MSPTVRDPQRLLDSRHKGLNGIESVEVGDRPHVLLVQFLLKAPGQIDVANLRITGGARIRDVRVIGLRLSGDDSPGAEQLMHVEVDRAGDFSIYTLSVVGLDGFDPLLSQCDFTFKPDRIDGLDCQPNRQRDIVASAAPEIDYLAKDYGSFRQLLLDRLALVMPEWKEAHVPDLGVAIVEALAYTGDYLSYYQDAVATEAYLGTARQRISVRRHARLVDYQIHEGCNARTWISVRTDSDFSVPSARDVSFVSDWTPALPAAPSVLAAAALDGVSHDRYQTFEPVLDLPLHAFASHSTISLHAWGSKEFSVPRGGTSAALRDCWVSRQAGTPTASTPRESAYEPVPNEPAPTVPERGLRHLKAGDFLMFEEVRSPATGQEADADHSHRHVVRLTKVEADFDPVYDQPIVRIEWADADALPFDLHVSAMGPAPDCTPIGPAAPHGQDISVARGNIVLVDHGRRVDEEVLDGWVPIADTAQTCEGVGQASEPVLVAGRYRAKLKHGPLTFGSAVPKDAPAATLLVQDPHACTPQIRLTAIPGRNDGTAPLFSLGNLHNASALAVTLVKTIRDKSDDPGDAHELLRQLSVQTTQLLHKYDGTDPVPESLRSSLQKDLTKLLQHWQVRADLLESGPEDLHYVAEIDNDGYAHLRFGDGDCGCAPVAGTQFVASYRVGEGPVGNVGSDILTHMVLRSGSANGAAITNPLPALGGTGPEPLDEIRSFAPTALRAQLQRAITAEDYAQLAQSHPQVQRAAATLRWSGSRYLVRVAIDPIGSETADPDLLNAITSYLYRYRRIGHDVEVVPAKYVSLDIAMTVHVQAHYLAKHVKAALLDVFSDRSLGNGKRGIFHPDELSFGTEIDLSRLVAAAQGVAGVESVVVDRLQRLYEGRNGEIESGVLRIGELEIPRLDNDPNFPEHGRFQLYMQGGR